MSNYTTKCPFEYTVIKESHAKNCRNNIGGTFGKSSIYEGRLFVLFCFVCTDEIHQTGMLQITFLVSLESS